MNDRKEKIELIHEQLCQVPTEKLNYVSEAVELLSGNIPPWDPRAVYERPLEGILVDAGSTEITGSVAHRAFKSVIQHYKRMAYAHPFLSR